MNIPVITLSSGLRVANFSSPHPFRFTTGETLPGCDADRCRSLSLKKVESETEGPKWTDISVSFELTDVVVHELDRLEDRDDIDLILVPLPVLMAVRDRGYSKVRGCLVADRVTKEVHPDRFAK